MAKLVFAVVFNTHMCRKKLTQRQKYKKPNDFRQARPKQSAICVRQTEPLFVCTMQH